MRSINLPNDIMTVVKTCIADILTYYQKYQATVKKRYTSGKKKGCVDVYCNHLSPKNENDPTGWLLALPLQMNSNLIPDIGDIVVIEFPFGKIDPCCYSAMSPYLYEYLKTSENKVLFEYEKGSIYYDQLTDNVVIENDSSKVIVKDDQIELKVGLTPSTEKSVLGESLKSWLESFLDDLKTFNVMTGVGPSGTIDGMPANATKIATAKANLSDILSDNVKNN